MQEELKMSKKVSYQNLLKQAIAEYDTSKNVEVKGPMLDPILSYDGGGELPTYKDAASILERYYFNEDRDEGIEIAEMDYENDKGEKGKGMEDAQGTGTQQAGTSDKATIPADMKEIEKDLAKEQDESGADEAEEEEAEAAVEENEMSGKDVPKAKKYVDEQEEDKGEKDEEKAEKEPEEEVTEDIENQVIEKLIAEMEEEDEDEDEKEEEVEEMKMTYTGDEPAVSNPKEKKSTGPEEDAQGAGTQQAGTGDADGQVPDRKDIADKMVKPKNYTEQDEPPKPEEEEEEEEELDVDKKMEEQAPAPSAVPGGPGPDKEDSDKDDDKYDSDAVSEAFELFKEQIEDED
jgi:hypothetical protein